MRIVETKGMPGGRVEQRIINLPPLPQAGASRLVEHMNRVYADLGGSLIFIVVPDDFEIVGDEELTHFNYRG